MSRRRCRHGLPVIGPASAYPAADAMTDRLAANVVSGALPMTAPVPCSPQRLH